MHGHIIPLFHKREFDFSGLAASSQASIVMAKAVDIVQWKESIVLNVRVHANATVGNGEMSVVLQGTFPSAEDPSVDFIGEHIMLIGLNSSTPAGTLMVGDFATFDVAYPFLRVSVWAMMGNPANTLRATISAELHVK